jgi:signal recognition particle subunit SRP54
MQPLNKIAGMIPGMPEYLIPQGNDAGATDRLRKFMVMMDSMNNAELDGKVDMHDKFDPNVESRIRRIAGGSGTHPNEVKMLLATHKQFEGMVSKMGKSGLVGKQAQARQQQMAQQMRKNPNMISQRLNQVSSLAARGSRRWHCRIQRLTNYFLYRWIRQCCNRWAVAIRSWP